jgi:hypothetical protein
MRLTLLARAAHVRHTTPSTHPSPHPSPPHSTLAPTPPHPHPRPHPTLTDVPIPRSPLPPPSPGTAPRSPPHPPVSPEPSPPPRRMAPRTSRHRASPPPSPPRSTRPTRSTHRYSTACRRAALWSSACPTCLRYLRPNSLTARSCSSAATGGRSLVACPNPNPGPDPNPDPNPSPDSTELCCSASLVLLILAACFVPDGRTRRTTDMVLSSTCTRAWTTSARGCLHSTHRRPSGRVPAPSLPWAPRAVAARARCRRRAASPRRKRRDAG